LFEFHWNGRDALSQSGYPMIFFIIYHKKISINYHLEHHTFLSLASLIANTSDKCK